MTDEIAPCIVALYQNLSIILVCITNYEIFLRRIRIIVYQQYYCYCSLQGFELYGREMQLGWGQDNEGEKYLDLVSWIVIRELN
jgi:hypothetical protein